MHAPCVRRDEGDLGGADAAHRRRVQIHLAPGLPMLRGVSEDRLNSFLPQPSVSAVPVTIALNFANISRFGVPFDLAPVVQLPHDDARLNSHAMGELIDARF